jgi:hypothetical protein
VADPNTPTQIAPHARILRDGLPLDPSVVGTPVVTGGYSVSLSGDGHEAFVDYVTGGPGTLDLTEPDGTVDTTDALDASAPVHALTLDAPTA